MKKHTKRGIVAGFMGDYRWLSNFERCDIHYKGLNYKSVESAWQAQRAEDSKVKYIFTRLESREAKHLGSSLISSDEWEKHKYEYLKEILNYKFHLHQFKWKLIDTGEMKLINTNHWGDTVLGIDASTGKGENLLGKFIMEIRENLKNEVKAK